VKNDIFKDIKLLYVEDDEDIRAVYTRFLERRLNNVFVATNGQEGYEYYLKYQPDLIITDIKMPLMTGLEMSSMIRDKNREIPIIITSAHNDNSFFQEAINIGVNMFLLKPVDFTQLFNMIKVTAEDIILKIKTQNETKILNDKNKMIAVTELLENIAHQWRQPLAAISAATINMNLDMSSGKYDNINVGEKIENIDNCVQYLSSTIDSFKHLVSDNNNTYMFDLSKNLQKCLNIESEIITNKGIKLVTIIDKDIKVNGLPDEFVQAMINIINNSIDVLEDVKDKLILVSVKRTGDKVIISVKDSGSGIKDSMINNLFEPYTTSKHKSLGIGLGLYLSYRIVNNIMNGKISANNCTFEYEGKNYSGANIQIEL